MKSAYWLFIFSFISTAVLAQTLTRGPYLQMGSSVSMQIRWRTDIPTNSQVTFGVSATALSSVITDTTKTIEHIITLARLQPNTKYFYRIGSTTKILQGDAENFFVTNPPIGSEKKIRIWATGDCGTGTQNQLDVKDQYLKYVGDNYTDAWLLLGDNAYDHGLDEEYQQGFFVPYQTKNKLLKQTAIYPCPGNHDYYAANVLAIDPSKIPYYNIFSMPTKGEIGGEPSGSKSYYSYNIGNVHFISLDSDVKEDGQYRLWVGFTKQRAWLKRDLEANKQKWTIVYFHHPPYSMGSHNSDTEEELVNLRQYLVPVLEEYKVDLVMTGHSHNYERSYLSKGHYGLMATYDSTKFRVSQSSAKYDGSKNSCPYVKQQDGTVYVVAGTAGFATKQQDTWPHKIMNTSITEAGSFVLEIEGNRLDAKFITEKGVIKDQFTVFKDINKTQNLTILPSQKITASASWNGTYRWANVGNATTKSVTFAPTQSGLYTVRDEQGCIADNFFVTIKPCNVGSFTVPANDGKIRTATLECTATDGFTHYYDELGNLIVSIKKGDNNVGKVGDNSLSLSMLGDNSVEKIVKSKDVNFDFPANGLSVLNNLWYFSPTPELPANKNVQVRLYFTDQDLQLLQKSTNSKDFQNYYLLKINELNNKNFVWDKSSIPLALKPNEAGAWYNFWADSLSSNQWTFSKLSDKLYAADLLTPLLKGGYMLGATTDGKQNVAAFDKLTGKYVPFDAVQLDWQTIAEIYNDRFVVERSFDKVKFDSIGVMKSQVQGRRIGQVAYSFMDKAATHPTIYYRLRSVGKGESAFSKTIDISIPITSISPTEHSEFIIYPNPSNIGKVQFNKPIRAEELRIIAPDGRTLLNTHEVHEVTTIDTSALPSGSYTLSILSKGVWYRQQMILGR